MSWFIKFVLGKLSGPVLVWIILALFAVNLTTATLLKSAWTKNAQAELLCINQALTDARDARSVVDAELLRIETELTESIKARAIAAQQAEKEIAARLAEKEIEHSHALADMEAAANEIADDEFFCATESISAELLIGMRNAAASYNQSRNSARTSTDTN